MKTLTRLTLSLGLVFGLFFFLGAGSAQANQPNWQQSYAAGTAYWWPVNGARWYNIYYKEAGEQWPMHAVRDLSQDTRSYTIMYLKPGVQYWYQLAAKNDAGAEYWWSGWTALKSWKMAAPAVGQTGGWGGTWSY